MPTCLKWCKCVSLKVASSSRMGGKLEKWDAADVVACERGVPIRGVARECTGTDRRGTETDGGTALELQSRSAPSSLSDVSRGI